MSANLHNLIIQGHPKSASTPSTSTHPHNDSSSKSVNAATSANQTPPTSHSVGPAAQLEISSEAQAMINHTSASTEADRSDRKIKTPAEAKAMLKTAKEQIFENPTAAKEVHTNLDAMRIIQKVF